MIFTIHFGDTHLFLETTKYCSTQLGLKSLAAPPGLTTFSIEFQGDLDGKDGFDRGTKVTRITPSKTNMTLEHLPFEDVFPIENGDFPMSCYSFRRVVGWEILLPTFCEGGLKIHPRPYFNQDLSSNDRDFKPYEMLGCPSCSNDHKYHHDNFACDTRYLFPSTTAYYVTTQTILSKPGSLAMFRRLGDIQTNLFRNLKPNLEYCFQFPPHESPSMIRIYFSSKKSGNGSPKWSYASADFHDFAVTNSPITLMALNLPWMHQWCSHWNREISSQLWHFSGRYTPGPFQSDWFSSQDSHFMDRYLSNFTILILAICPINATGLP